MSKFLRQEDFTSELATLELLPISIERAREGRYLVSNMVGDIVAMDSQQLQRLVDLKMELGDGLYEIAIEGMLVCHHDQLASKQMLALRLRSRMSFLLSTTPLHIFVVSLRCEHSCPYCQVSRQSTDRRAFDMTEEIAERAINIAFEAPSPIIKIEFQGGEPLLNFEIIKFVVQRASQKSAESNKELQFVITTNLALLSDEHLRFCKDNKIMISTSLDGPPDIHNLNRPRAGGDSHARAIAGIRRAKEALGDGQVGALMTTTQASLARASDIVDEYLKHGLDGIFLRPLSPYGFARKTKSYDRYKMDDWCAFYEEGLEHILHINKNGKHFPEFYARLLMRRMFTDLPTGYVDLRSPAGIGLGALVYNYNGDVFASDEGRMLAEMGDSRFKIGDVWRDDFASLLLSETMTSAVAESLTQCAPMCSTCAFEPHCGADPVYHYATQGDFAGIKPLSAFCHRQKFMFKLLLNKLETCPDDAVILRSWIP